MQLYLQSNKILFLLVSPQNLHDCKRMNANMKGFVGNRKEERQTEETKLFFTPSP